MRFDTTYRLCGHKHNLSVCVQEGLTFLFFQLPLAPQKKILNPQGNITVIRGPGMWKQQRNITGNKRTFMSQVAGGWGTRGGRIAHWGLGTSELPENQGSLIPVTPAASGGYRVEPNIKFKRNWVMSPLWYSWGGGGVTTTQSWENARVAQTEGHSTKSLTLLKSVKVMKKEERLRNCHRLETQETGRLNAMWGNWIRNRTVGQKEC